MRQQRMKDLITNTKKLQSFLDNALTPLVVGLKDEPALAAWEIMNEPEGSVISTTHDANPCFDTNAVLANSGAGWAGESQTMEHLLRFFNLHAATIKKVDPTALVTVGSWSQYASTDAQITKGTAFFNYYKDACLIAGGGEKSGVLDFYQIHTYAHSAGLFDHGSPFGVGVVEKSTYALDKPMVVGEFSAMGTRKGATPRSIQSLFSMALDKQFAGAWDWCLIGHDGNDNESIADQGMSSIATNVLVPVDIK